MEPHSYLESMPGHSQLQPVHESSTDGTRKLSLRPRLPEIDLTCVRIDSTAARLLSLDLMRQFRVVPFSYDADSRALKVACQSPHDRGLADELSSRAGGAHVELFAATPSAIDAAIAQLKSATLAQHWAPPKGHANPDAPSTKLAPVIPTAAENLVLPPKLPSSITHREAVNLPMRGSLLFVTPKGKLSEHLLFAYAAERYEAKAVGSVAAACEVLDRQSFDHVFVHDSFRTACDVLASKFRERNAGTALHFFNSEASLLISDTEDQLTRELFVRNLHLFRHLHDVSNPALFTHAGEVTRIADLVAVKCSLPSGVRYAITTAAALHDLSQSDLTNPEQYAHVDIIALTAGRLATWGYPDQIVVMLRSMYRKRSHIDIHQHDHADLAGAILTAADIYCHNRPNRSGGTTENCREAIRTLRELVTPYASEDVVQKLTEIALVDMRRFSEAGSSFQVHIFSTGGSVVNSLQKALDGAGLSASVSCTVEECALAFSERAPQALVLHHQGEGRTLYDLILALALKGVAIDRTPTILLFDDTSAPEAMSFIKHGIEDVLPASVTVDVLVTKLNRLKVRLDEKAHSRLAVLKELGTHGSLEDMNLIDLLEASRGSSRPSHISVSANGQHLTVVVDKGTIIRAEANDTSGIDAIQQGIAWKQGVWSIDPIDQSELPTPNLNKGIDSVLLEACVQHDNAAIE
ncbi:MAG: DUF4388 domain-containing protein [Candidatus Zixiibacteriota bacterium]